MWMVWSLLKVRHLLKFLSTPPSGFVTCPDDPNTRLQCRRARRDVTIQSSAQHGDLQHIDLQNARAPYSKKREGGGGGSCTVINEVDRSVDSSACTILTIANIEGDTMSLPDQMNVYSQMFTCPPAPPSPPFPCAPPPSSLQCRRQRKGQGPGTLGEGGGGVDGDNGAHQLTTRPPNGSKAIMRRSRAGTLGVPPSSTRNCALRQITRLSIALTSPWVTHTDVSLSVSSVAAHGRHRMARRLLAGSRMQISS